MEENRLTHKVPNWNTRNPTSNTPSNSSSSLSQLEPNNCNNDKVLMNHKTQASCKAPSTKDNTNDGKVIEEHKDEVDDVDEATVVEEMMTGRERLKRHREEVKGHVKIPENWGQEQLLKEWIVDYTTFDALLLPRHRLIVAARDALAADGRKARPWWPL